MLIYEIYLNLFLDDDEDLIDEEEDKQNLDEKI
jgi:hypothetical protein